MWKKSEPEEFQPQPEPAPTPQPVAPPPRMSVPQAREQSAVVGSSIFIKGDLTGEEDLSIDGRLEGKIESRRHNVTVGKSGCIKGDIYGKLIIVEGTVEGNLYGEEQLIVRHSGTVRGNIVSPRVALEDGSNFKGSIDMSPKEKSAAAPAPEVTSLILDRSLPSSSIMKKPGLPSRSDANRISCTPGASVGATTAGWVGVTGASVVRGRFLADLDEQHMENVCVITTGLARRLFPYQDPLTQSIKVNSFYYRVVGLVQERNMPEQRTQAGKMEGEPLDNNVYIALSAARSRFGEVLVRRTASSGAACAWERSPRPSRGWGRTSRTESAFPFPPGPTHLISVVVAGRLESGD